MTFLTCCPPEAVADDGSRRENLVAEAVTVPKDDLPTIVAISVVALILATMLHEGLGHGALALLTGATSGTLSTVAWSSVYDSRLVAAGGTLVNLACGTRLLDRTSGCAQCLCATRFFLLIACAFNLFTGTGYFFFSGVTNFGDWAQVIAGMQPYWLWRRCSSLLA